MLSNVDKKKVAKAMHCQSETPALLLPPPPPAPIPSDWPGAAKYSLGMSNFKYSLPFVFSLFNFSSKTIQAWYWRKFK